MTAADETPAPRPGTNADVGRRVDRLESRVDDLAATVARVELNQKHSEELNALRHDALKGGLDTLTGTVSQFMGRIEGIIAGDVETNQTRQGQALVADYMKWRGDVDRRLDEQDVRNARGEGVWVALGGAKGAILMAAAVASPLITIVAILVSQPK